MVYANKKFIRMTIIRSHGISTIRGIRINSLIRIIFMRKLIIIDGNALVHRAFHALPPLAAPSGQIVNAVYGFSSVLIKIIKDLKPDYLVAAFDLAGPTLRHDEFVEYKAQRKKAPDELRSEEHTSEL